MPPILTDRDLSVLDTLAWRVRVMTISQISRAYFGLDDRYASRRVAALARTQLLVTHSVVARVPGLFLSPMFRWEEGESPPAANRISVKLMERWRNLPALAVTVVTLGSRGAKLVGGNRTARIAHVHQVGHDLGLTEVYIRHLDRVPAIMTRWFGEHALRVLQDSGTESWGLRPDAVMLDSREKVAHAIELGGLYSPARIQALHEALASYGVTYEIW